MFYANLVQSFHILSRMKFGNSVLSNFSIHLIQKLWLFSTASFRFSYLVFIISETVRFTVLAICLNLDMDHALTRGENLERLYGKANKSHWMFELFHHLIEFKVHSENSTFTLYNVVDASNLNKFNSVELQSTLYSIVQYIHYNTIIFVPLKRTLQELILGIKLAKAAGNKFHLILLHFTCVHSKTLSLLHERLTKTNKFCLNIHLNLVVKLLLHIIQFS